MTLIHERTSQRDDYNYYRTDRSVTVQVGRSTNAGKFVWSVHHPDIKCAIWGGECSSLSAAEKEASEWVLQWVNPGKT